MATKFIDCPDAFNATSGDANLGLWTGSGSPVFDTTVNNNGIGSWKLSTLSDGLTSLAASVADAGTRISFYHWVGSVPGSGSSVNYCNVQNSAGTSVYILGLKNTGSGAKFCIGPTIATSKLGTTTISANTLYKMTLVHVITSTTSYTIKLYVNGVLELTVTNADFSLTTVTSNKFKIFGNSGVVNVQNFYIDNGTGLDYPGDIQTTAKRPNANGTANGFTVQIGSGGSGYGTGHSPQVNERPVNSANGWHPPATTGTKTEEYNIESASTGDIDISADTLIDYMGWIYGALTGSGGSPTDHIILNGVSTVITLPSTAGYVSAFAGSTTYPAGTGTDIGLDCSSASAKLTNLYDCGVIVAYLAPSGTVYSVSLSESCTAADIPSDAATLPSAVNDNLSAADSPSNIATLPSAIAESAAASDAVSVPANYTVSVSETASAADAPSDTATLPSTIGEAGAAADTESSLATLPSAIAESAAASDTASSTATLPSGVAETGTAADAPSSTATLPSTVGETGSASDSQSDTATLSSAVVETGTASDTPSSTVTRPAPISDSLTISDSASTTAPVAVSINEAATAADTLSDTAILPAQTSDTLGAADIATSTADFGASIAEVAAADDTSSSLATMVASLAELVAAQDTALATLTALCSVAEVADAADDVVSLADLEAALLEIAAAQDQQTSLSVLTIVEQVTLDDTVSSRIVEFPQFVLPGARRTRCLPGTARTRVLEASRVRRLGAETKVTILIGARRTRVLAGKG